MPAGAGYVNGEGELVPFSTPSDQNSGRIGLIGLSPSITNIENWNDNMLYWVILGRLARDHPDKFAEIVKDQFQNSAKVVVAACGVARGEGNHIGEYASLRLASLFLERWGMITTAQASNFDAELIAITVADMGTDVATSFSNDIASVLGKVMGGK